MIDYWTWIGENNERIDVFSGQTTCNGGLGRVVYERLPDQQLQGFDDDVV